MNCVRIIIAMWVKLSCIIMILVMSHVIPDRVKMSGAANAHKHARYRIFTHEAAL